MDVVIIIVFSIVLLVIFQGVIQAGAHVKKCKELGVSLMGKLKHINGLPIPEETLCECFSYPTRYEIKANGLVFNLKKDNISDICIKTHTEIQKQIVSSIGGTIGGAVIGGAIGGAVFGTLGAIIGGRAKTKKNATATKYLIFTYLADNDVKYLGFILTNNSEELLARKIVNEFVQIKKYNLNAMAQIDLCSGETNVQKGNGEECLSSDSVVNKVEVSLSKTVVEPKKKSKARGCLLCFIGVVSLCALFVNLVLVPSEKAKKTSITEKNDNTSPLQQMQTPPIAETEHNKVVAKVEMRNPVFNVMEYKNISGEKLIQLLGKPDKITEGTCTGAFKIPCQVYTYKAVDFTLVNNRVIRFHSLHQYPFTNKHRILHDLGIQREDTCRLIADTNYALRYRSPVKGIDEVWISLIDGDTFNSLQVTYDMSYYEEWYLELTDKEKVKYQMDAKERIKSILSFPQTANFPWTDWSYGKNLFYIVIASHVDYKNAYGVEIRTKFALAYSRLTGEVVRVVFGDEVVDNGYIPTEKLIMELVNKGQELLQKTGEMK